MSQLVFTTLIESLKKLLDKIIFYFYFFISDRTRTFPPSGPEDEKKISPLLVPAHFSLQFATWRANTVGGGGAGREERAQFYFTAVRPRPFWSRPLLAHCSLESGERGRGGGANRAGVGVQFGKHGQQELEMRNLARWDN